ncbi:MAG: hypothetical protein V4489_06175 [Chlamydiota bacterium]
MTQSPYETYCKWNVKDPLAEKGFVVAADLTQEWLLPWWWEKYKEHNNAPVAFIDLGLSQEMKRWCKERGHYIHLPVADLFVSGKENFPSKKAKDLEKEFGERIWISRNAWFKKPLACLQSPFKKSVWMDLDCEVKDNLNDIFSLPLIPTSIAVIKEHLPGKDPNVNSGVILFEKDAAILEDWARESLANNVSYPGDQDVLYALILKNKPPLTDLPPIYNWSRLNNDNPEALVIHWHGNHGKVVINHQWQRSQMEKEGLLF